MWDPKSEPAPTCNRQNHKLQRPSSVYHQPSATASSYTHRYVHPVQNSITTTHAYIQPQSTAKPKSWDNLSGCGGGGYAFGYLVNNPTSNKHPVNSNRGQPMTQQARGAPPLPRKAGHIPYGYSTFANVENYVPAPPGYVQEATITKTTIITTKSTENLISNAQYNLSDGSCECIPHPSPKLADTVVTSNNCMACNVANNNSNSYQGYYSNLARNASNRCIIPTKTEITRL